jgi:gliding motility-associated-like protein
LRILALFENELVGPIPNFELPNLDTMWLEYNQLTGNIPNFNMPKLRSLWLFENKLTGEIPKFDLPTLNDLSLFRNQLNGNIPLFNLPSAKGIFLYDNLLEGCLSDTLIKFCSPSINVDISGNPNLATQSWNAFCNDNEGICCFRPIVVDLTEKATINEEKVVDLRALGVYPDSSAWRIISVNNDKLSLKECTLDGSLTFAFNKHFFGKTEIVLEACGLQCSKCDSFLYIISDEYLPDITPTNVFTPDGNSFNDVLKFNNETEIFDSELHIYNRWGDRIYYKKDYTNDWDADGYPGGVYYYLLQVKDIVLKSSLTIIK